MKNFRYFIILFSLFFGLNVYSQDVTQVTFISELDKKFNATYGDALIMFKIQTGSSVYSKKKSGSEKTPFILSGYTEDEQLTKGMASLMTARYINLGGSIMYIIFGTERYAYKVCIANGIFSDGGSENDKMTGPELIELFSKITDLKGGK